MYSSSAIFRVCFLWIAVGDGVHSSLINLQPNNNVPVPGISYSWIIPPQSQNPPPPPPDRSPDFDPSNESPITPIGGYGHPPFYLRHSHEQLSLPNEFLITPANPNNPHQGRGGLVISSPPLFQQLDPNKVLMNQVDCDGGPTCPNVDVTYQPQQQEHSTTQQQSNIASVPANAPPSDNRQQQRESAFALPSGQPVNWPSSHGGGIGLLFFVPESASHLPVEQLIRQQLDLHRTQFPFDISINCNDAGGSGSGAGCSPVGGGLSEPPPPPPTASWNGWNVENVNYASPALVEIVNSSRRRGSQEHQRKWRTIGERIVRNKQHQNRMMMQEQQQQQLQQLQQLQQNQRELSILP